MNEFCHNLGTRHQFLTFSAQHVLFAFVYILKIISFLIYLKIHELNQKTTEK